jgi:copper chaperone
MLTVTIAKMKCGGCAAGVEKAVKSVDTQATVAVDLATKRVDITSSADNQSIVAAIEAAGYPTAAA